jgi:hypothetical protein
VFSHKYFLHEPIYAGFLRSSKERGDPLLRFTALMLFTHDLFGWFDDYPSLSKVQLTSVATVDVEKVPLAMRIRHHFKLILTGSAEASAALVDVEGYAHDRLPWEILGHGAFTLHRDDTLVQTYINLPKDRIEDYQVLVFQLARRIDIIFQNISVIHDVGLRSAFASN